MDPELKVILILGGLVLTAMVFIIKLVSTELDHDGDD